MGQIDSIPSAARSTSGSPWQNAYGESFNGRLRDECLMLEWFRTVAEAQVVIAMWRREYHEHRPHSSLGYQTPVEFRRAYDDQQMQAERLELIKLPTNGATLTT